MRRSTSRSSRDATLRSAGGLLPGGLRGEPPGVPAIVLHPWGADGELRASRAGPRRRAARDRRGELRARGSRSAVDRQSAARTASRASAPRGIQRGAAQARRANRAARRRRARLRPRAQPLRLLRTSGAPTRTTSTSIAISSTTRAPIPTTPSIPKSTPARARGVAWSAPCRGRGGPRLLRRRARRTGACKRP